MSVEIDSCGSVVCEGTKCEQWTTCEGRCILCPILIVLQKMKSKQTSVS